MNLWQFLLQNHAEVLQLTGEHLWLVGVSTILAVLIGVPLGIRVSRRETSANLGVAISLALGYYFLTVMVGWLDGHPEYRPDLLLWIPNAIFLALGGWMLWRIDRR